MHFDGGSFLAERNWEIHGTQTSSFSADLEHGRHAAGLPHPRVSAQASATTDFPKCICLPTPAAVFGDRPPCRHVTEKAKIVLLEVSTGRFVDFLRRNSPLAPEESILPRSSPYHWSCSRSPFPDSSAATLCRYPYSSPRHCAFLLGCNEAGGLKSLGVFLRYFLRSSL